VTGYKEGKYEKAFVSGIYNRMSRSLFRVTVRDLNSVKAYRREVMDTLPNRPDWHRYMVVMAAAGGFTVSEVPVPLTHATRDNPSLESSASGGLLEHAASWSRCGCARKLSSRTAGRRISRQSTGCGDSKLGLSAWRG